MEYVQSCIFIGDGPGMYMSLYATSRDMSAEIRTSFCKKLDQPGMGNLSMLKDNIPVFLLKSGRNS